MCACPANLLAPAGEPKREHRQTANCRRWSTLDFFYAVKDATKVASAKRLRVRIKKGAGSLAKKHSGFGLALTQQLYRLPVESHA